MLPNVLMPVLGRGEEGIRKSLLSSSQFLVENLLGSERSLSPEDSGNESPRAGRPSPELSDHEDKFWNGKRKKNFDYFQPSAVSPTIFLDFLLNVLKVSAVGGFRR